MLFSLMHVIHLLAVILWIGGLGFITILVLPLIIKMPDPLQKVLFFQRIEHRFAPMARIYNAITGITGFIMMFMAGAQDLLFTRQGFPLLFMTGVWVFWAIMLFGLEPIIIRRMLDNMIKGGGKMEIETVFSRMNRLHVALLALSLTAVAAGAAFAHWLFI